MMNLMILLLLTIVISVSSYHSLRSSNVIRRRSFYCTSSSSSSSDIVAVTKVEIQYCTGCKWMLRSAWLAQGYIFTINTIIIIVIIIITIELLITFEKELHSVTLTPDRSQKGVFVVKVNNDVVWDRKNSDTPGRFY